MGVVSFAESLFFPIPPDVMLVPTILANRQKALTDPHWSARSARYSAGCWATPRLLFFRDDRRLGGEDLRS